MDVRPNIQPSQFKKVLSVSFNEDKSFFAVGLENGFMVFRADHATVVLKKDLVAGIGLAQMMGSSNVIALVGGGRRPKFAANKVMLWDERKQRGGTEITTLTPIRAARLTKDTVVVALQNSVQIHDFNSGKVLHQYETADNLSGLVCLSRKQIAFPGRTRGQFQIVELDTGNVTIIPSHDSPLRALAFSPDGDLLATASDKGTIIRVYNTFNCACVSEVRRGVDPATIYDLCFSPSGCLLACTSDKGTLHIFDVPHPSKRDADVGPSTPVFTTSNNVAVSSRPGSSSSSGGGGSSGNDGKGKWGWLSQVPGLPRVFRDTYSFTSIPFSTGDEVAGGWAELSEFATLGTTKPQKGVIGWYEEDSLVVVGAGVDARWEKYQMARDDNGRRFIGRIGFKRYFND